MGELLRKTIGRITEAEAKKEDSELQMYSQEPSGAMGEQDPEPVEPEPERVEEPTGDAERVAQEFHETYERLAPEHGYDTRDASKGTWDEVPEENRNLMTAVVGDLIERGVIALGEGEAEVDAEVPTEEPPLPETGDGDPWVPLEAVEGFCGECAREMMSRNIKAARLSVLTEAGLVEAVGDLEEKKADGWPKKLKAGRFTEWCKRNGFKGGPSIASVKKVMESGDESVRGCAKFFADIIKPEGKDFAAIMGKGKK